MRQHIFSCKLKSFFFALTFCFCHLISFAQKHKIDSLLQVSKTQKEDSNKVNTLTLLTRQVYLTGNYDTTLLYANQSKALAEKINFKKGIANAYNNIGNVYFAQGNYPEALKNHSASLKIQTEINYKLGIASSENNIGNIYFYQGIFSEALKNYLEAMKIYKERPDAKKNLAASYNNIGNVYFSQNNFLDALTNYVAAANTRKEIGDKLGLANAYNNIGNVYFSQNNYAEALKNYANSLNLRIEIEDNQGIAASYSNIGNVYFTQGNYDEALKSYFAAEKTSSEIGDKLVMANAYSNMGLAYVKQNKNSTAIDVLNKSMKLGQDLKSKEVLKNSFFGLAQADSAMGNWNAAFEHHKMFVTYRDSLSNEENVQKITKTQMTFDFEQKEIEMKAEQDKKDLLTKAEKEKEDATLNRQKLTNWFVASSLTFLLLFSLLVFNRFRLKQKNMHQQQLNKQQKEQANAVIETQEQERKRIAEDLHDSLGHLLSTVKLNLQTFPTDQKYLVENPLELLNQASSEIRNITFNLMPRTLEEAGLVPALNELATKISSAGTIIVFLQVHGMENTVLEKQTQFNIYRIIQEAVNNILKHAQAKEINLQLIQQDKQLSIMIEDDGKGFDSDKIKNGRGIKNITTRSTWLNGTIAIDSTPGRGTTIAVQLPILN
jgi:signal transduction histidine kinase/uncharacterized protein HemY